MLTMSKQGSLFWEKEWYSVLNMKIEAVIFEE